MKLPSLLLLPVLALLAFTGCAAKYTVPGRPADFGPLGLTPLVKRSLTDTSVQQHLDKKPLAAFPAAIAVARVQGSGYQNQSLTSVGTGAYSVIITRDVESDDDFNQLAALSQVKGIVGLKRILLPPTLSSDVELRAAAAQLHADLLLVYTFDTAVKVDTTLEPLSVITLGLAPNQNARLTTTASAILMDTANGYIYAVCESTAKDSQLANAWTSTQAMEHVRRRTEADAFKSLLEAFKQEWPHVLATYAPAATPHAQR